MKNKDMSTIKFTVEDSKVSEVLKTLLNSNISIRDVEIVSARPNNKTCITPYGYVATSPHAVSQPYVFDTWRSSTTWSV